MCEAVVILWLWGSVLFREEEGCDLYKCTEMDRWYLYFRPLFHKETVKCELIIIIISSVIV